MTWLAAFYPWTKALHILSVIAWMAGLLYLPRLFVYHCEVTPGSPESDRFATMERRLLRAIMYPAMGATYLFGVAVAATPGIVDWSAGWIWAKLVLVGILTVMHDRFARWSQDFAAGRNARSARFYRIANEVPAILLVGIVILVVVRPF